MYKYRFLFIVIFTLLLFVVSSCIDPPDQFIAPTYDVELNFPITDSLYTIEDFIDNDSNFVPSTDPDKLGLLYYINTNEIDPYFVKDDLTLDDVEVSNSTNLKSLKIEDTPYIKAIIGISDLLPISGGSDAIVPPFTSTINKNFEPIDNFVSADFESGNMEMNVKNNMPFPIELSNIIIKNSTDGSIIGEYTGTPITVAPYDSTRINFSLANKHVNKILEIEGTVSSEGSNGETIPIPEDSHILISLRFTDFVLDRVTAILPEQGQLQVDSSIVITDSTKIETAIFDEGNVSIVIDNTIDLDINVWLQIHNILMPDGSPYTETFVVKRKTNGQLFQIESLKGWSIVSNTPGELINELNYSFKISSDATEDVRTVSQTDSVNVNFTMTNVVLSYAKGLVKPTSFDIPPSELNIDLGGVEDKLTFDSLFINDPSLVLKINSSINFDAILYGKLTGYSDNLTNELNITLDLPAMFHGEFDLKDQGISEFINSFMKAGSIPTRFVFSGNGIVNPNYVVGSVSKYDSVSGTTNFELPFELGIDGGSFLDTIHVENIDISEEDIQSVNSVFLTILTDNKIPVSLIMNGSVIDANGDLLTKIPPSYNPSKYIQIDAPLVDNDGNVISSTPYTQQIELRAAEAQDFLRNPNLILSVKFDTPPPNSVKTVRFKTTDNVFFKIYGKINYRVN